VFQFGHALDSQSVQGPRGSEIALVEFGFFFLARAINSAIFSLSAVETETPFASQLFFATVDDLWLSPSSPSVACSTKAAMVCKAELELLAPQPVKL